MANYRMTIQYDGTRYSGWQSQHATDATIQGKLETVLTRMTGQQVDVIGSGRTDAGVHAIGQVANFHLKQPRDTGELLDGLNRYLPEDIAVIGFDNVDISCMTTPPLTTVGQPLYDMGEKAIDLLIQKIEDPRTSGMVQTIRFANQLIVRQTT